MAQPGRSSSAGLAANLYVSLEKCCSAREAGNCFPPNQLSRFDPGGGSPPCATVPPAPRRPRAPRSPPHWRPPAHRTAQRGSAGTRCAPCAPGLPWPQGPHHHSGARACGSSAINILQLGSTPLSHLDPNSCVGSGDGVDERGTASERERAGRERGRGWASCGPEQSLAGHTEGCVGRGRRWCRS